MTNPIIPAPPLTGEAAPAPVTIAQTPQTDSIAALTPAGRIAALTALKDAIEERLKVEKETLVAKLAGAEANKSIPTPFGPLSYIPESTPMKIDDEKLLEYVMTVAPEVVETTTIEVIPDYYRQTLVKDVIHLGDGVFARSSTGEIIEYAYFGTEVGAKIAFPASAEQKASKAAARRVVRSNLERFAAPMLEVTDGRP